MSIAYCEKEYQSADWKKHKRVRDVSAKNNRGRGKGGIHSLVAGKEENERVEEAYKKK